MREDAAQIPSPRLRTRLSGGLRTSANWFQLLRFAVVGASGYLVNLAVFAVAIGPLGAGHAGFQAARFLVVSLAAFLIALAILELLVIAGMPELAAQAVAVVCATPVNFLGNRLWSFRR